MIVIKQDITEETSGLIIHGVNCQNVMGSGVALAIKTKWPEIYEQYMRRPGKEMLGVMDVVRISWDLFVGNCYTQEFYGSDGKVYASIDAVKSSLREAFMFASACELPLKMPKIGCGLAGLSWENDVLPIVEELEAEYPDVQLTLFVV